MRIGVLTTASFPYFGYIVDALRDHDIVPDHILLDSQPAMPEELEIERERTQGKLPFYLLHHLTKRNLALHQFASHQSDECAAFIRDNEIDLLINAGTPRILKRSVLTAPKIGVINCHPGLLPEFRGCTCVEWAIYLDEPIGNTAHFMSEGIDEGPIILREALRFSTADRYSDVRTAVYRAGFALLARATIKVVRDGLRPTTLPSQPAGHYFDVISKDAFQAVVRRLEQGAYAYQS